MLLCVADVTNTSYFSLPVNQFTLNKLMHDIYSLTLRNVSHYVSTWVCYSMLILTLPLFSLSHISVYVNSYMS